MGGYYGKYNESAAELSRFIFEAKIDVFDKTNGVVGNSNLNRYNYAYNFKK